MKAPKLAYVIEDDPITAVITQLIAKQKLHCKAVQLYANGQLAFDRLRTAPPSPDDIPDLILLDLNMPMMDGWEFLDAFSQLTVSKPVCVFILTSSIHPDDLEKSRQYKEVKGYFSKPLDTDNVARMKLLLNELQEVA